MNQNINPRQSTRSALRHSEDIDLMKYLYLFLGNLQWFALAIFFSAGIAYFINKHAPKIYKVSASILIEDKSVSPVMGSMFGRTEMMAGMYPNYNNFQNQILIMKSQSLISQTLHSLDFSVSYYKDKIFGAQEVFNEAPFIIMPDYSELQPLGVNFIIEYKSDGSIKMESEVTEENVILYSFVSENSSVGPEKFNINKDIRYGEKIEGDGYSFTVLPREGNQAKSKVKPGKWLFSFNSYKNLVAIWGELLDLKSIEQDASMVRLEINSVCPDKAQIFINKHLETYLQRSIDKKNQVATNTINFIDSQLSSISDSLNNTGITLQDFRKNNRVLDLSFQSQQLFEQTKELDNQKAILMMKDDYFRYLRSYLSRTKDAGDIVAPSVMGVDDPLLNSLVLELNKMADQKIAMTSTGESVNPYLRTLEAQINNTKMVLEENSLNLLNNNSLAMDDVTQRLDKLMAEVKKLPQTERELLGIERKFKLNDNIYTYLLQRRAESQITKASNTADNEIIDFATFNKPIRPRPLRNYTISLIVGLLLPGSILVLKSIFNYKITSEEDVKLVTDLPVAGHIMHSTMDYQTVVLTDPKSHVAETFRSFRTRLQFFTKETRSPVILITSSMPAEGKTFASINLASAYSLTGKKTVLVGFDLRKPKLYNDFNLKNDKGVSTYLIGLHNIDDIIQESGYQNLSVITSGTIPPNPAELASSLKTTELFTELRKRFDYIIIDSAPLGAVSDTFSLAAIADITVVLVRHNKTIKHILENILADAKANGISGISLLLNDIRRDKRVYSFTGRYHYGYGNYYSYGENHEKDYNIREGKFGKFFIDLFRT